MSADAAAPHLSLGWRNDGRILACLESLTWTPLALMSKPPVTVNDPLTHHVHKSSSLYSGSFMQGPIGKFISSSQPSLFPGKPVSWLPYPQAEGTPWVSWWTESLLPLSPSKRMIPTTLQMVLQTMRASLSFLL